jgi:glycosyltransferase involved in cell wall biosynthesis
MAVPTIPNGGCSLTCPRPGIAAQLLVLSRNFGSFTAVRTGLAAARGQYIAVMAADLQEPPSLVTDFYRALADGHDVAVGTRANRDDALKQRVPSRLFWVLYRTLVNPQMPPGGVDMFAGDGTRSRCAAHTG